MRDGVVGVGCLDEEMGAGWLSGGLENGLQLRKGASSVVVGDAVPLWTNTYGAAVGSVLAAMSRCCR